ncbi:Heat stress transcription factor A-4b [Vitis vinifera]|uniref:Heat stress transcription factor A-4b n=1 Tax=Vitis vinifera TaxID=29760 RepID=A0A438DBZ4_VITVI|nr:Heat stress transcription factor A-4b [Vitis vinifera]
MEASQSTSSNSPPPFLTKTYEMGDDPITDSIVSWSQAGHSLLFGIPLSSPKICSPSTSSTTTFQLCQAAEYLLEFANEEFIRGQRHLLKNIHRRKPIHSHSTQNQVGSAPLPESEKQEFEAEIERLKHDKGALLSELQRYKQENQFFEFQTQSLGKRVFNMELRQRKMMAYLAQILQKPGFTSSLMAQSEIHNKKRRLLMPNYLFNEANVEENMGSDFPERKAGHNSVQGENVEMIESLESSLNFWENFLYGIGQGSADVMDGFGTLSQPSPIIITEMHSSSDPDTSTQPCSPKSYPSSPHSKDIHSSPEIDVNSEPTNASEVEASKECEGGTTAAGANDVFWAQFLTETPGSSDAQEVQSERRDAYGGKGTVSQMTTGNIGLSGWLYINLTKRYDYLGPIVTDYKFSPHCCGACQELLQYVNDFIIWLMRLQELKLEVELREVP